MNVIQWEKWIRVSWDLHEGIRMAIFMKSQFKSYAKDHGLKCLYHSINSYVVDEY